MPSVAVTESEVNRPISRDLGKINAIFKPHPAFIIVKPTITILYNAEPPLPDAAPPLRPAADPEPAARRALTGPPQCDHNALPCSGEARAAPPPESPAHDLASTPYLVGRRHPRLGASRRGRRRGDRRRPDPDAAAPPRRSRRAENAGDRVRRTTPARQARPPRTPIPPQHSPKSPLTKRSRAPTPISTRRG